ncbi:MAG TPA: hexose kinase [Chloroflexota bacterium]
MITVLSLNTAIDRLLVVPGFAAGNVYRARGARRFAGGKGLNVARAVRQLGEGVRVLGFAGGMTGEFVDAWCRKRGIEARWVVTECESRTCVIVVDPDADRQTVLNEPGPNISADELDRMRHLVQESVGPGDLLAISGSPPPGVPEQFYAEIVFELARWGVRVLIDAAGDVLRLALEAGPWSAAPNRNELEGVTGRTMGERDAADWLARRTQCALLTLGRDGLIFAADSRMWRLSAPDVDSVNAVGSGDALVAGFLVASARGAEPLEAARLAAACGAANAERLEPGIGDLERVEDLVRVVGAERV